MRSISIGGDEMEGDLVYTTEINGYKIEYQQIQGTNKWEATAYDDQGNQARSDWMHDSGKCIEQAVYCLQEGYFWHDDAASIVFDRDLKHIPINDYNSPNENDLNSGSVEINNQAILYYSDWVSTLKNIGFYATLVVLSLAALGSLVMLLTLGAGG